MKKIFKPAGEEAPPAVEPLTAESITELSLAEDTTVKVIEAANTHGITLEGLKALQASLTPAPVEPPTIEVPDTATIKAMYPDDVKVDDSKLDGFQKFVAEHSLSTATVKAMVEADAKRAKDTISDTDKRWEEQEKQWKNELEKDSLLTAGDGFDSNFKKLQTLVKDYGGKVDDKTGLNELQQALNLTGLGNHPAMARFLMRLQKALPGEGTNLPGGKPPGGPSRNAAEILFPSMVN